MNPFDVFKEQFGIEISIYHTIIIGSGAAGLNCALHLKEGGLDPNKVAIITEQLGGGTSFNTGSDKQTYYKMSMIGEQKDSPVEMAKDMYNGGAMHGDIALIEATNSVREFFHLINLGVPFPHDKYGGYIGYKTDYDPRQRATSIGPLTSQKMCKCLLNAVNQVNIKIWDKHFAFKVIIEKEHSHERAIGLITLDLNSLSDKKDLKDIIRCLRIFLAKNIIIATGGPAALYKHSVYPKSQWGGLGLAINAGCKLQNLTESQFGLASTQFRWNLSGSYQQIIPRYFSVDNNDKEIEFLRKYFPSFKKLSKAIFLKGYQWPFNSERIENYNSSLIDLAVHYETEILGNKVFLDFRNNPKDYNHQELDEVVIKYLENADAIAEHPIERLQRLNPDAIDLYLKNGINLWEEPIEIAVCNQHLNGGIQGDIWWETNIKNLFVIGEANGSHGVHRPGGAALNSGQVGGLRAAQRITHGYKSNSLPTLVEYEKILENYVFSIRKELELILSYKEYRKHPDQILKEIRNRMAKYGSILRPLNGLSKELKMIETEISNLPSIIGIESHQDIILYFRIKDALKTQEFILKAILNYHKLNGKSRGSYLIIRDELNPSMNEQYIYPPKELKQFKFIKSDIDFKNKIQTIKASNGAIEFKWEERRSIPKAIGSFETIWKRFKNNKVFK